MHQHEHSYAWSESIVLPDGHNIVVERTALDVDRLPSKNAYTLAVPAQTGLPASITKWSSQGLGRAVLKPLGLRVLPNGAARLITIHRGGYPDEGTPLGPGCSPYVAFIYGQGRWSRDPNGFDAADAQVFKAAFNLSVSEYGGKATVAEKNTRAEKEGYAREILRLMPEANRKQTVICPSALDGSALRKRSTATQESVSHP
jgi:hypothetical protein